MAETASKERPILFSGDMVRAILSGRKTQTRRIVKPQPKPETRGWWCTCFSTDKKRVGEWEPRNGRKSIIGTEQTGERVRCPYGDIGDRLWVRETWTPDHADFYPHHAVVYRADKGFDYERDDDGQVYSPESRRSFPYRWRPSIHMPRWASRITLEITAVRVERLQDMSDQDALAEGIEPMDPAFDPECGARGQFIGLWESIYGPESWTENPWVWVIEFKRLEA